MSVKLILAEDHVIIRQGLRTLIEKQEGLRIVAEADDGRVAVRLARELSPDLVIMDVTMPNLNGIEATRRIVSEKPGVKVIGLSMHSNRRFVLEMLTAGASAYLLKDCVFDELVHAIRIVMKGHMYLSPKLSDDMLSDYVKHSLKVESSAFSTLSEREREVLQMIAEGKSTKEIAAILSLSVKTIETHRQQIMSKLGIRSIADLTKYAILEGLTSLEIL